MHIALVNTSQVPNTDWPGQQLIPGQWSSRWEGRCPTVTTEASVDWHTKLVHECVKETKQKQETSSVKKNSIMSSWPHL